MVTNDKRTTRRTIARGGFAVVDLMIAAAILTIAVLPLAYSFHRERQLARAYYVQAVAMEIVDGEMEALAADDDWAARPPGRRAGRAP